MSDRAKTGVTACIVAYNESANIGRALESVRTIADEFVVVDNGSTDDTAAIAERFGAKVVPFMWDQDLSASRNAAWPHVSNRWAFWIDADERLLPNSEPHVAECTSRDDALAFAVTRKDYESGVGPRQWVGIHQIRLVRTDLGIHFTGCYHEQLEPPLNELADRTGLKIVASRIVLDHYCDYFGPGRTAKQTRNAVLLLREVAERPGRLYFVIQCAAALLDMGDPRGHDMMRTVVTRLAENHRHDRRAPQPIVFFALEYAAMTPGLAISPEEALDIAQRWFPDAAPVIWHLARRDFLRGDDAAAIPRLRKLLELGRTHAYDFAVPFEPSIIGDDARINLAACLIRTGELAEAETLLREIRPTAPRYAEAQANLKAIAALRLQFPDQ